MYKQIIILFLICSYALGWGKNATTMEFRSAKTAARSERDLNRAETLALKALEMEAHTNDARVAYFLAIEIYKPKKNWVEMNRMLDIAMERNPEQLLERPFKLTDSKAKRSYLMEQLLRDYAAKSTKMLDHAAMEETDDVIIIKTISQAVIVYKDQIWMNSFNQAVELIEAGRFEEALEKASDEKFIDLQIKFETYLEDNYNWIFLLRASKYIYVILPLILVLGFIFHRYRSKKILVQWKIEEELEDADWSRKLPN